MSVSTSPQHKTYLRKRKLYRIKIFTVRALVLICFFLFWELAGNFGWINPFITSQPSRIAKTLISLHRDGTLYYHVGITVFETSVGFCAGTVLGTALAILLWWSRFLADTLEPYLVVLNSLPKIALAPILIVWMGHGIMAIITMALFISVVVTILSVYTGFANVDPEKVKLLKIFGATRWQIFCKAIFPASIPTVISALKINVGLSWVGVIVGEFLVSRAGLGYLIVYGGQVFRLDLVMTSVLVLALAAAIMYQLVAWAESHLTKWR